MKEAHMSHKLALIPLLILSLAGCSATPNASATSMTYKATPKAMAFHDAMRKLWEDHIIWTRVFIISAAADLPDKSAATDRLLRNQDDIANAITPYYGAEASQKLDALLKEHITIAGELVTASKASDTAKAQDAQTRWTTNADAIASLLSGANPKNWPEADMKNEMHQHLAATAEEATARLKGDWAGDIAAFDKVHEQILGMADMLSAGIIRQYPAKF
jgi:hypothetical protein